MPTRNQSLSYPVSRTSQGASGKLLSGKSAEEQVAYIKENLETWRSFKEAEKQEL